MLRWSEHPKLRDLSVFYSALQKNSEAFSDEQIIQAVHQSFWSTNCWAFVEASLAIISPACALRPNLTEALIEEPIRAMVYGGFINADDVVAQGVALANKPNPEVELTDDGRKWLQEEWPKYDALCRKVFQKITKE